MSITEYIKKLESIIEEMEEDFYHTSETATIVENAPLALMQVAHNTKLRTLKSVAKDLKENLGQ